MKPLTPRMRIFFTDSDRSFLIQYSAAARRMDLVARPPCPRFFHEKSVVAPITFEGVIRGAKNGLEGRSGRVVGQFVKLTQYLSGIRWTLAGAGLDSQSGSFGSL